MPPKKKTAFFERKTLAPAKLAPLVRELHSNAESIFKDAYLVDCMIALPSQLFYSVQIPACLWFLTKNQKAQSVDGERDYRNCEGYFTGIAA